MRALFKQREQINLLRERMDAVANTKPEHSGKDKKYHYVTMVDRYLNSLKIHSKRSNLTIASITNSLSCFANFMIKNKHVDLKKFYTTDCTESNVRQWLDYEVSTNNNSTRTRNMKLSHMRNFINYVSDEYFSFKHGELAINISKIPSIKPVQTIKECLTTSQVVSIIKIARGMNKGYRNCVMLLLLSETAIRASELVSLRVKSINLRYENPSIHVEGKNRKNRVVPLNQDTANIMRSYMSTVHTSSNDDTPLFFSNIKGRHEALTTRTLRGILSECGKTARMTDPDIPEVVHPHMLRRSRATSLYQNNAPIELIASMLGHSSIETTSKYYAKPSDDQIREHMDNSELSKGWNKTPNLEDPKVTNVLDLLRRANSARRDKKKK